MNRSFESIVRKNKHYKLQLESEEAEVTKDEVEEDTKEMVDAENSKKLLLNASSVTS